MGDDQPSRVDNDGCHRADGKTLQWMVETSNPNGLMRLGWTKRSLKPGDEITVDGFRAKDGSKHGKCRASYSCGWPPGICGFVRHTADNDGHDTERKVGYGEGLAPISWPGDIAGNHLLTDCSGCGSALGTDCRDLAKGAPCGRTQIAGRTPRPAGPVDEEHRGISGPLRGLAGWHEFCGAGPRKGQWRRTRRTDVRIYPGGRSGAKEPDTAGI